MGGLGEGRGDTHAVRIALTLAVTKRGCGSEGAVLAGQQAGGGGRGQSPRKTRLLPWVGKFARVKEKRRRLAVPALEWPRKRPPGRWREVPRASWTRGSSWSAALNRLMFCLFPSLSGCCHLIQSISRSARGSGSGAAEAAAVGPPGPGRRVRCGHWRRQWQLGSCARGAWLGDTRRGRLPAPAAKPRWEACGAPEPASQPAGWLGNFSC